MKGKKRMNYFGTHYDEWLARQLVRIRKMQKLQMEMIFASKYIEEEDENWFLEE